MSAESLTEWVPFMTDDQTCVAGQSDSKQPLQPCRLCCRDWQADPSTLLCRTCVTVDELLAQRAGATHFLPHIVTRKLSSQPDEVMACALHSARFPRETGFYGVYTTMSGSLRRACSERLRAAGQALIDSSRRDGAYGIEPQLEQPSHEHSLTCVAELVAAYIKPAHAWLQSQLDWARGECAVADEQELLLVSDFQSARLVNALARNAGIYTRGEHS